MGAGHGLGLGLAVVLAEVPRPREVEEEVGGRKVRAGSNWADHLVLRLDFIRGRR